jgi:hypothetical protein
MELPDSFVDEVKNVESNNDAKVSTPPLMVQQGPVSCSVRWIRGRKPRFIPRPFLRAALSPEPSATMETAETLNGTSSDVPPENSMSEKPAYPTLPEVIMTARRAGYSHITVRSDYSPERTLDLTTHHELEDHHYDLIRQLMREREAQELPEPEVKDPFYAAQFRC